VAHACIVGSCPSTEKKKRKIQRMLGLVWMSKMSSRSSYTYSFLRNHSYRPYFPPVKSGNGLLSQGWEGYQWRCYKTDVLPLLGWWEGVTSSFSQPVWSFSPPGKLIICNVTGIAHRRPQGESYDQAIRNDETGLWQCPFCQQDNFPELSEVSAAASL
jgi:hypothetical protein